MIRRPPRSTRTDTLFPYTTLFRSMLVNDFAPDEVFLLPLYPQFSTTTTGSSVRMWREACRIARLDVPPRLLRSEEHTSELPSLMRLSYSVFCLQKQKHLYLPHNGHSTHRYTSIPTSNFRYHT